MKSQPLDAEKVKMTKALKNEGFTNLEIEKQLDLFNRTVIKYMKS